MRTETIPLEETHSFSSSFLDYIQGNPLLEPFYRAYPSKENFGEVITSRNFPSERRKVLSEVLREQYNDLEIPTEVSTNMDLLQHENSFTITTGHQLNIFTGPLYFIYKIVTVINACKELKEVYPEHNFIPVYWMASEDHDFDEISYFKLEGSKIRWETDQQGAVGRFDPAELVKIADTLPEAASFFADAYRSATLADAVRVYVNRLFGDEGLLIIDADHHQLKKQLIPVIEEDLFSHSTETLVTKNSNELAKNGYKTQVFPRQINFFFLRDNIRDRIVRTDEGFEVVDQDIHFSEEEMKELIRTNPEFFSPNVAIRPLYQESILPNLAYVGGPSELIYWLQLKSVFDYNQIPFPLLVPRNFALICPTNLEAKWKKTGLSFKDLFLSSDQAISKWVKHNSSAETDYAKEISTLEKLNEVMKAKASQVDPTLKQHLESLHAGFIAKIHKAEKKIERAEKRKHKEKRSQIEAVKNSLFSGGSLQERTENFLSFYAKDPSFIQKLKEQLDPFVFEMYLFFE